MPDLYTHEQIAKAAREDVIVHTLVQQMVHAMKTLMVTPAELRAIATFAAMEFEKTRPMSFMVKTERHGGTQLDLGGRFAGG